MGFCFFTTLFVARNDVKRHRSAVLGTAEIVLWGRKRFWGRGLLVFLGSYSMNRIDRGKNEGIEEVVVSSESF